MNHYTLAKVKKRMKDIVEAILFAKTRGLTVNENKKICKKSKEKIEKALHNLKKEYEKRNSGIVIECIDRQWGMRIRHDLVGKVTEL